MEDFLALVVMVKVKMVKMTPGTGIFTHYKIYINIYLYSAYFSFFGTDFDQNDFDNHDLLSSFVPLYLMPSGTCNTIVAISFLYFCCKYPRMPV